MIETDDASRGADGGTRWWIALVAVSAALVPSALTLVIWLGTGSARDPEPTFLLEPNERIIAVREAIEEGLDPRRVDAIRQIFLQSQIDADECKADYADTTNEPSSERLPFYFC